MTLSNNIDTISTALDDIKDAIIAKGVTPLGNITTYAQAISDIQTGGGDIVREVSATGVYQFNTNAYVFSLPDNVTDLGEYVLAGLTNGRPNQSGYINSSGITFLDLSSLTTISGSNALTSACYGCTNLTRIDLSNLTTVSGNTAMYFAFRDCTGLTSVDFSSLTTLSGSSAMSFAFQDCTGLTSVDFSSLTTLSGSSAMSYAFYRCTSLTTLSFPSLTSTSFGSYTNQFNGMLSGVTGCTVHFPSNLQSVIGSWSSVTSGFSGTNTTVLFDLPATT